MTLAKARWTIVEYNVVYDCRAFKIYLDASKYATVRYNLVYDSAIVQVGADGIKA